MAVADNPARIRDVADAIALELTAETFARALERAAAQALNCRAWTCFL